MYKSIQYFNEKCAKRFENLEDDYYIYDENTKSIVGKHLKKVYKLGDKIEVEVIDANKELRRIDFKISYRV